MDNHCNHYKFNTINKEIINITNGGSELQFSFTKLKYIKSHKKLFAFGSNQNNSIFSYNNNKWNINQLNMPKSGIHSSYAMLNEFDNILLALYFWEKEIFVLDLLNMKWF